MDLMPAEIAARMPTLYATEHETDPLCHVKFFTRDGAWTWYGTEYDPEQGLFFGYVVGLAAELGYFSLGDLEAARGPRGLAVECDLYFAPMRLSEVRRAAEGDTR